MQHPHQEQLSRVTVYRPNEVDIVLTLHKHPIRGKTRAEWLEEQCVQVLGKDEMAWCGGRWRLRIQDEPGKMERVLAEVKTQQKEGKAIRNSGAYAEDLWQRWV